MSPFKSCQEIKKFSRYPLIEISASSLYFNDTIYPENYVFIFNFGEFCKVLT